MGGVSNASGPEDPTEGLTSSDIPQVPFIIGWANRTYEGGLPGLCGSFGLDLEQVQFVVNLVTDWFPYWLKQQEAPSSPAQRDVFGHTIDPWTDNYRLWLDRVPDPVQQAIIIRIFDQVLEDWQKVTSISDWTEKTYAEAGGLRALCVSDEYGLTPENAVLFERFIVEWYPFWLQAQIRSQRPFPVVTRDDVVMLDESALLANLEQLRPWLAVFQSYLVMVRDETQQRIFTQLLDKVVTDRQAAVMANRGNN